MAEDDDGLAKGSPRPLEKSPVEESEETSVGLASVDAADENAPLHALECGFTFFFIQDSGDEDGHTFGKVEIVAITYPHVYLRIRICVRQNIHTSLQPANVTHCAGSPFAGILLYVLLSMHRHDKLLSLTAIYISRVCVCVFVYIFVCMCDVGASELFRQTVI